MGHPHHPTGRGPNISLDRVAQPPPLGEVSRVHLDLYTDDGAGEVERLLALGATRYEREPGPDDDFASSSIPTATASASSTSPTRVQRPTSPPPQPGGRSVGGARQASHRRRSGAAPSASEERGRRRVGSRPGPRRPRDRAIPSHETACQQATAACLKVVRKSVASRDDAH